MELVRENIINNISVLLEKNPWIKNSLEKLNAANIRYGLYAGAYVSVVCGGRKINDIDFVVAHDDMQKLKELFPFAKTEDYGDCIILYLGENDMLQFVAYPSECVGESFFYIGLTDLSWEYSQQIFFGGGFINVLNPVDTILQKSALQRTKALGKSDIEDIELLLAQEIPIDKEYLKKRLKEFPHKKRMKRILEEYNLL